MQSEVRNNQRIIANFMKERDRPAWFRGLSEFQREAADSLINCIRDDSLQSTSHRVRHALQRIGFEPPVGPSKVRLVMHLSRGNDIAFLWFLMELYYRSSEGPTGYSCNEKLFLTIIAYLDTIPTLRELDKILPKKLEKPKTKKAQPVKQEQKCKLCMVLPYFQKQPRPILYGKDLTMEAPCQVASFKDYEHGLQPNFCVVNENSRWFARYELHKSQKDAKQIDNDEVEDIFQEYCENKAICEHHQSLRALKESLENARIAAKKKDCRKYFDIDTYFKNSYKQLMTELNREIAKTKKRNLHARRSSVIDNATRLPFDPNEQDRWSNIINNAQLSTEDVPRKQSKVTFNGSGSEIPAKKDLVQVHQDVDESGSEVPTEQDFLQIHLDGPLNTEGPLFQAATANKPYKFNYDRIFDMGYKDPIKDAITSALNEGQRNKEIDQSQAVKKICKEMWSDEVKTYNLKYEREQKALKLTKERKKDQDEAIAVDEVNEKVISQILLKGLAKLKENKKFVLPTLPDAHKLPALKQWVRSRYGMYLTREDKIKQFEHCKKVFHALQKNALKVPCPRLHNLAQKQLVSYGCHDYLIKKGNYLREVYEQQFKDSLLEDVRVYWSAVRPYHCSKGPPRNVFYAYLPARKNDIHMFRPWKKNEFMDAKAEWIKRQRIKNIELLY